MDSIDSKRLNKCATKKAHKKPIFSQKHIRAHITILEKNIDKPKNVSTK